VPGNQPPSNSLRTRVPIVSSTCSLSCSLSRSLSRSFVSFCFRSSLSRVCVHLCCLTCLKNCLHDGHCSPLTSEAVRSSALTSPGWETLQCFNRTASELNFLSGGVEASWHSKQYPMKDMLGLYPAPPAPTASPPKQNFKSGSNGHNPGETHIKIEQTRHT
jgi:hypothetical protein